MGESIKFDGSEFFLFLYTLLYLISSQAFLQELKALFLLSSQQQSFQVDNGFYFTQGVFMA